MRLAIYFILVLILSSCGARYHLKRAQHHIDKAKEKGADVKSDTVYLTKTITVPEIRTDTVFESGLGDTVTIEKENLQIKYVQLPGKKVYIQGKVRDNKIIIKVPYMVETIIKAPPPKVTVWEAVLYSISALVIGIIIGVILAKIFL